MKNTYFKLGLLAGVSFVSAGTAFASAQSTIILDKNGVENLRLQTVEVVERDFETTVFAIGRIEEIPANQSVLSSRVAGRVTDLKVFEGDAVKAGDVIATVETRQLGDPPPSVDLQAPQSGLVITSHVRLGQPVQPDVELMDISYAWSPKTCFMAGNDSGTGLSGTRPLKPQTNRQPTLPCTL